MMLSMGFEGHKGCGDCISAAHGIRIDHTTVWILLNLYSSKKLTVNDTIKQNDPVNDVAEGKMR